MRLSPPDATHRPSQTRPSGIVTLSSDFGLRDPFVGVMTGAVLRHHPEARVVQLCHGIAPQATRHAAFWLERCYRWFTPGTVHLVVVDPGVGSNRALLAAHVDSHFFVLPDAGLIGPHLLGRSDARIVSIDAAALGLPRPSATFHGRDLFAPVAAHLASGTWRIEELGNSVQPRPSHLPASFDAPGGRQGEIVVVDHFGNLLTNLEWSDDESFADRRVRVGSAGPLLDVRRTYSDVKPGEAIALVNSFGVLEIAVRNGSARATLEVGEGTPVTLLERSTTS